jgi:predicted CXXCH cytochrome family protein
MSLSTNSHFADNTSICNLLKLKENYVAQKMLSYIIMNQYAGLIKTNLLLIFLSSLTFFSLISTNLIAEPGKMKNQFHRDCVCCHIPNGNQGVSPLWNKNIESPFFALSKKSGTKNQTHSSKLCLGCHDGTIAQDHEINLKDGSQDASGIDPKKSHPISVDYMTAYSQKGSKKLHHPSTIEPLKLYDGKVECNTCHDTHQSFRLRVSISRSELCFRCHNV